jgi:hypothetical protein
MAQLYPRDKHCPLRDEAWSVARIQAGIRDILCHAVGAFDPEYLWPRHPLDGDDPVGSGYYFGAGGVFWGVSYLSREGLLDAPEGWFGPQLEALIERNRAERAGFEMDSRRSYLFGDIPLLMLLDVHEQRGARGSSRRGQGQAPLVCSTRAVEQRAGVTCPS